MKKRILLVTATGGHLDQALALLPAFPDCDVTMVTYRKRFNAELRHPQLKDVRFVAKYSDFFSFKLFVSLCVNLWEFLRIIRDVRPHMILSTGSEIAVPAFAAAMLFPRIRRIHLETAIRIHDLSLTGKCMRFLANRIYAQWPELVPHRKSNIVCAGRLF